MAPRMEKVTIPEMMLVTVSRTLTTKASLQEENKNRLSLKVMYSKATNQSSPIKRFPHFSSIRKHIEYLGNCPS